MVRPPATFPIGLLLSPVGTFLTVAAARQLPATTLSAQQSIFFDYWFHSAVLFVVVILLLSLSLPLSCTYFAERAPWPKLPATTATGSVLLQHWFRTSCRPLEAERLEKSKLSRSSWCLRQCCSHIFRPSLSVKGRQPRRVCRLHPGMPHSPLLCLIITLHL